MKSLLKSLSLIFFLGLYFAFFSDILFLFNNTVFYIFQARDIQRAIDILQGKFIFFGPELTGGGHLPGPLYYYLMSIVLWIKESWVSVWGLQYLLIFIASLVAYFHYFKKNGESAIAFFWLVIFASHPLTSWFIRIFLNVSFMLPFAICALVFTLASFSEENYNRRKNFYFAASFSIGLGLHFHFSIIFLFLALVFLNLFSRILNLPSFKKVHIAIGFIFLVMPVIPYFLWVYLPVFRIKFGVEAFNSGVAKEVAGTLLFLVKKGLEMPIDLKAKLWTQKIVMTMPLSIYILLPSADLKKFWNENKVLVICFIFSLFPFSLWLFSPQAIRYTILTYVTSIFIVLRLLQNIIENEKRTSFFVKWGLVSGALLIISFFAFSEKFIYLKNFSAMMLSLFLILIFLVIIEWEIVRVNRKHLIPLVVFCFVSFIHGLIPEGNFFKFNDNDKYMPSVTAWKHIWTNVRSRTGWSYEEARKRLFFIGHHMSQSAELGYKSSEVNKYDNVLSTEVSGFIISNRHAPQNLETDTGWILQQNLPKEIISGIKNKKIILQKSISNKILIIPYSVVEESGLPKYFQNISEGYRQSSRDVELEKIFGNEKAVKINDGHFVFKWNECPDHNKFCSTGVFVEVVKDDKKSYSINGEIVGNSLAQITPWISPDWNQAWINPYAEINCGGRKMRYQLATSIGYNRRLSHNMKVPLFQGNNSILAPFEFNIKFKCDFENIELSIGREYSLIDTVTAVRQLPGAVLKISL